MGSAARTADTSRDDNAVSVSNMEKTMLFLLPILHLLG
jgi:hypothetical protein